MKHLQNHRYSNCGYYTNGAGEVIFVSYSTPVVRIDTDGYVHAGRYFNCSATTRKQVGWFLQEMTDINYGYLKIHALQGLAVHAFNGDYIPE